MYKTNYKKIFLISFIVFHSYLFGYLDPGTLSYLGSLLVGLVVGLVVYAKLIFFKMKSIFNRVIKRKR